MSYFPRETGECEDSHLLETSSFSSSSEDLGDIGPIEMTFFPNNNNPFVDVRPHNSDAADSLSALATFTEQFASNFNSLSSSQISSKGGSHTCATKSVGPCLLERNHTMTSKVHGEEEDVTSWTCAVCGDAASGRYFGALVCLPCKSFFIRRLQRNQSEFPDRCDGSCDVTVRSDPSRCPRCRFQKCLAVGMCRKERPDVIIPTEEEALCAVCGDIANGVHFGVLSCEGCKKFFRRGLSEHPSYACKLSGRCTMNPRMRTSCRYCRFQRCLQVGMSRITKGKQKRRKRPKCGPRKTDTTGHQNPRDSHPKVTTQRQQQNVPEHGRATATLGQNVTVHGNGNVNDSLNDSPDALCTEGRSGLSAMNRSSLSSDSASAGQACVAGPDSIHGICLTSQDELTSPDSYVANEEGLVIEDVSDAGEDATAIEQNEFTEAEHADTLLDELCKVVNDLSQEIDVPSPRSQSPPTAQTSPSRAGDAAVTCSSPQVLTSSDQTNAVSDSASASSDAKYSCRASENPSSSSSPHCQLPVKSEDQSQTSDDKEIDIVKGNNGQRIRGGSCPTSMDAHTHCSCKGSTRTEHCQEELSNKREEHDKNYLPHTRRHPTPVSCWLPSFEQHRACPSRKRTMTEQRSQCAKRVNPNRVHSTVNEDAVCESFTASRICNRSYSQCKKKERNDTVTIYCDSPCSTPSVCTPCSDNRSCFQTLLPGCSHRDGIFSHDRPCTARHRTHTAGNRISSEIPEGNDRCRFSHSERIVNPCFVRVNNKRRRLSYEYNASCSSSDQSSKARIDNQESRHQRKHCGCLVWAEQAPIDIGHTQREGSAMHTCEQPESSRERRSLRNSSNQRELDQYMSSTVNSLSDDTFPKKTSPACSATAVCQSCSQTIRVCTTCHPCPALTRGDPL